MKIAKLMFAVLVVLGGLVSAIASGQTPDTDTPANEGICDGLVGGTPGLYGLCVAFCEAQDYADITAPVTEEQLEALEDASPSGRVLANYRKKMQPGDPDMPCIEVEEPCPCWSAAELASIDGVLSTAYPGSLQCLDEQLGTFSQALIIEGRGGFLAIDQEMARTYCRFGQASCESDTGPAYQKACQYVNKQSGIERLLWVGETMTFEQYQACREQVRQAIAATGCSTSFYTD